MDTTNVSSKGRRKGDKGKDTGGNSRKMVSTWKIRNLRIFPFWGHQVTAAATFESALTALYWRWATQLLHKRTALRKKKKIMKQLKNSDTLCYHDYSHLAMKVSEHKYSYICVYIGVVLESDRKMAREREKCIYAGLLFSSHSTRSRLNGLSTLSRLVLLPLLMQHQRAYTGVWASEASASNILVPSSVSPLKRRAHLRDEIRYEISKTSRNRLAHCTDHVAYQNTYRRMLMFSAWMNSKTKLHGERKIYWKTNAFEIGSIII